MPSGSLNRRKLFIVYNRSIAKARKSGNDPKLIQRLHLAFGILQHHDYYVAEREQYHPTATSCNCKDFQYFYARKRGYKLHCKHQIATILMERAEKITYNQMDFLGVL